MATPAAYPVRVEARLDPQLSHWLWLVKWLLAVPRYVILCLICLKSLSRPKVDMRVHVFMSGRRSGAGPRACRARAVPVGWPARGRAGRW
jgi:hypothetical protein